MPSDTILCDDNDKLHANSTLRICCYRKKLIIEEDLSEGNIKSLFCGSCRQIASENAF